MDFVKRNIYFRAFRVTIRQREFKNTRIYIVILLFRSRSIPVCITIYGIRECRRSPAALVACFLHNVHVITTTATNETMTHRLLRVTNFPIGSFHRLRYN